MVITAFDVGRQRIFTCVTAGPVPTVVTKGDGFGERHVEPERPRDCNGDLRHLEGMSETSSLVVFWKHEYLGLASESTK